MSLKFYFPKIKESQKEKSYPGPCPIVHVSTYPMKLAAKALMKQKKEADSGSTHVAQLRGRDEKETS